MKAIGQLIRALAVNYEALHDYNQQCRRAEYGSEEHTRASERRERHREYAKEAIEELKALGIDPEMSI